MKAQLELKDLFIGKVDAKNESTDGSKNADRFRDGFLVPDNINPHAFLNGERYYIIGLKGTGKTALLKYIQLIAEQNNAQTLLILFKSDFSDEDKASFSKAAGCIVDTASQAEDMRDFSNVWMWYFHRQIVNLIIERNLVNMIFVNDNDWEKYKACVLAPKLGDSDSGIMRLMPKLKRGNIEVEGDFLSIKGKLGLDFEWADDTKSVVKFSDIVKQANALFQKLHIVKSPFSLYLFLDELELSFNKSKQYQTDIRLIRDVIIAINKFNDFSCKLHFPIRIITSIRSEVLTAIEITGKEINKATTDFGITLKWPQRGDDSQSHPLIGIITKKIAASYKMLGLSPLSDDDIWSTFFPSKIGDKSIYEFIIHKTWYRPRDIIRMLAIAQNQFPNQTSFTQSVLETINKEYSTECWKEQTEELRAIYNEEELSGIKQILIAIKCPFSYIELNKKCESKKIYASVNFLFQKHNLADVLSNLYRIGVIGNSGQRMRFSFRGDDELIIENNMTIHPALWNFLSVEKNISQ